MEIEWIRKSYQVPASKGCIVRADGKTGMIVGSRNQYLKIKISGENKSTCYHPTWHMEYFDTEGRIIWSGYEK